MAEEAIEARKPEIAGEDTKAAKLADAMAAFEEMGNWARQLQGAMLRSGMFWCGALIGAFGGGVMSGQMAERWEEWNKAGEVAKSGGLFGWWLLVVLLPGFFAGMAVVMAFILVILGRMG